MSRARATTMVIFDDGRGHLGPMADLRAAFEVRTGMHTTARRLAIFRPRTLAGYWVPAALAPLVAARADAPVNRLPDEEIILCVNGRLALPDDAMEMSLGEALLEESSGHCIAACLRRADAAYFLETGELSERVIRRSTGQRRLYRYPWDVIASLETTLAHDLAAILMPQARVATDLADVAGDHPVDVAPGATVFPGVILDATAGAVVIETDAVIRPGAVLSGPCVVGRGSVVTDRAVIRGGTVVGPGCRVGGEVAQTIFQGFANKAHDGFVGHSWVGRWVNLGAGTTTSNLLNTYSPVSMRIEPDGPRFRTGLVFLGSIIGDHVKTGILSRLMAGSSIGTGAMIATTQAVPTTVGRYAWLTDRGEQCYRFTRFVETVETVMARRSQRPGPEYIERMRTLHPDPA